MNISRKRLQILFTWPLIYPVWGSWRIRGFREIQKMQGIWGIWGIWESGEPRKSRDSRKFRECTHYDTNASLTTVPPLRSVYTSIHCLRHSVFFFVIVFFVGKAGGKASGTHSLPILRQDVGAVAASATTKPSTKTFKLRCFTMHDANATLTTALPLRSVYTWIHPPRHYVFFLHHILFQHSRVNGFGCVKLKAV